MLGIGRKALVLVALCIGLAACSDAPEDANAPKVLTVGVYTLPPQLGNPHSGTGIPTIFTWAAMFDTLTYVTKQGELKPALATAWEQLDESTWRFTLRDDVTFHNGVPFDASVVKANIDYLISPDAVMESAAREIRSVSGAEVESPTSLIVTTAYPNPLLPRHLAMMFIVEWGQRAALGREGFGQEPVGTGPFKLVEWRSNGASFEAHDGSYRPPKVDQLDLIVLPQTASRLQALQSGQIDIAIQMEPDNIADVEAFGGSVDISPDVSVLGITFILDQIPDDHPLQNKQVRQALNYAVDRQGYIDALFFGTTVAANQPTTRAGFGYNPDLPQYTYDPERARQMLADAGYPDGFAFEASVVCGAGAVNCPSYARAAAGLANVGVELTLREIPTPQLIRGIQQGEWRTEAFGMNYSADRTTDALRSLRLHSCIQRVPWYCDRDLTDRLEAAFAVPDLEGRRAETKAIMEAYHDEAPAIWLHEIAAYTALGPRVSGFELDLYFPRYDLVDVN